MNTEREEELKKQIAPLQAELNQIRNREKLEENKKLIGKFFKTRNNYSSPKTHDDYWWFYKMVRGFDEDGSLEISGFQDDKKGRIEIDANICFIHQGDIEITEKEFNEAWQALITKLIERS